MIRVSFLKRNNRLTRVFTVKLLVLQGLNTAKLHLLSLGLTPDLFIAFKKYKVPCKYNFADNRKINKTYHFLCNTSSFILHSQKSCEIVQNNILFLADKEIEGQKRKMTSPESYGWLVPRLPLKLEPLEILLCFRLPYKDRYHSLSRWTKFLFSLIFLRNTCPNIKLVPVKQ